MATPQEYEKVQCGPAESIAEFNVLWPCFMETLATQIPALASSFELIINKMYTLLRRDQNLLMYYFMTQTAEYMHLIKARDDSYFDVLYELSDHQGIPKDFAKYLKASLSQQEQEEMWATIGLLIEIASSVYPEYKAEYQACE